jgi:competence ComEA-like helix-hairpin-helix protein
MFTRDERRALLFLALLAGAGGVLRAVRPPGEAPGAPLVAPEVRGDDLAAQLEAVRRATLLARPLRPGERIDVDRASSEELERLPRVGAELARRIAAEREVHGPFGSLEGLDRVPGVGAVMLRDLEPVVTFSGVARPPGTVPGAASSPAWGAPGAAAERPRSASPAGRCAAGHPVPVNRASAAELECLPGIGAALAERIVADRTRRGPFRELKDLERVPGIGPRLAERLAGGVALP